MANSDCTGCASGDECPAKTSLPSAAAPRSSILSAPTPPPARRPFPWRTLLSRVAWLLPPLGYYLKVRRVRTVLEAEIGFIYGRKQLDDPIVKRSIARRCWFFWVPSWAWNWKQRAWDMQRAALALDDGTTEGED